MTFKEEYNDYVKQFAEIRKDLTTDNGDVASKNMMLIEGINFRVSEIIAILNCQESDEYIKIKESDTVTTDTYAKEKAAQIVRDNNEGVSSIHFERMSKSFQSVIMSFKKRLKEIEWGRYNVA